MNPATFPTLPTEQQRHTCGGNSARVTCNASSSQVGRFLSSSGDRGSFLTLSRESGADRCQPEDAKSLSPRFYAPSVYLNPLLTFAFAWAEIPYTD